MLAMSAARRKLARLVEKKRAETRRTERNKGNCMTRECKIGNVTLKNPFLLAPLAGVTDAPFRRICGEKGAGLVCSEMVSAKGLWYKDKNTDRLLEILDGEAPVALPDFWP